MGEWPVFPLEEVCETITDGAHASPKDCVRGLPMASVKDMTRWGINVESARRISHGDFDVLVRNGCQPRIGDVLIAKDGATCLDTVCEFIQQDKIVLLSSIAILRPSRSLHSGFLRYYLDCADTRAMLKAGYVSGSAIPRVVLKDFRRAPIPLPPLPEQRAIAHILGTLDDKIELNRRRNETLEAMARALFKSWFVDFDPVREKMKRKGAKAQGRKEANEASHESLASSRPGGLAFPPHILDLFPDSFEDSELGPIPKGWRVGRLGDVIEVFDSRRIPLSSRERALRKGIYPYHGAASVMDFVDDYLFDGIYLLIGEDGSVINEDGTPVMQYVWGKFWVNNHAHVLQGKNGICTEHLLLHLKNSNIASFVTGAVQPKLNQGNMNRIPIVRPPKQIGEAFAGVIAPMFGKIRGSIEESRTLAQIRDALLPKLISGELRVADAEKFIEREDAMTQGRKREKS